MFTSRTIIRDELETHGHVDSTPEAFVTVLGTIDDLSAIEVLTICVEVDDRDVVLKLEERRADTVISVCGAYLLHVVIIPGTMCHLLDLLRLLPIDGQTALVDLFCIYDTSDRTIMHQSGICEQILADIFLKCLSEGLIATAHHDESSDKKYLRGFGKKALQLR